MYEFFPYRSIADETVTDVRAEEEHVTYTLVDNGNLRGRKTLVSANGYSFVFKRTLMSGM